MIRQRPPLILKRMPNQRLKKRFKLPVNTLAQSTPSISLPILPKAPAREARPICDREGGTVLVLLSRETRRGYRRSVRGRGVWTFWGL